MNPYILPCKLICGLKLEYVSDHEIKVKPGFAYDDIGARTPLECEEDFILDITEDLDTGSEENDKWYHIWIAKDIHYNGLLAKFSLSDTDPVLPAGYMAKRRIGAVRNKWGGDFARFIQIGNGSTREYIYGEQRNTWCRILDSGNAADWYPVDCQGKIPPAGTLGYFLVTNKEGAGANGMRVRHKGSIGTTGMCFVRKGWYSSATIAQGNPIRVPVVDGCIEYKVDNEEGSGHIEILGYVEEL